MNKTIPKYEAVIDFDQTKVKEAVNKFIELNQNSDFHVKSRNDHAGIYVLSLLKNNFWNGCSEGNITISVQEYEKTKVKLVVDIDNTGMNDPENYNDLVEAQSQLLHALFNILSGNLEQKIVVIPMGKGCLGMFLVLIIGIGTLYYFF
ncbi:hypothetical protein [Draconibacterium sediminis]|uniref:Uncharacterized protein n=1 Tax=Draconibacterium sediminis TaxID=1544798 RepID=A0A0D8JAS4_9BACT|nr:hypothetical protein [Draconibacterium sediminis]KJF43626.1 hypothetical protein LH29_10970 [Draconibacterium sediminis]